MFKYLSALVDLIKYRLSIAVVLSSVTGYYLCRNTSDHHLFFLIAGVFLLSCGSAVLNQYTERIPDSIMKRTKTRPIPSGKISKNNALGISLVLLISGGIFLYSNGTIPFLLGIFTVMLYNLLYTNLKKVTIFSIIPGALVGALPPVIGYYSAGGTVFNHNILAFSTFMFLWQIPHFWLIVIKYGKEYRAAGFATVSRYLNETQIKYLVFFWVLSSNGFLFLNCILNDDFNKPLILIISLLNFLFISLFYRLLFVEKKSHGINGAFILLNSFGLFLMFLIIAASFLKSL